MGDGKEKDAHIIASYSKNPGYHDPETGKKLDGPYFDSSISTANFTKEKIKELRKIGVIPHTLLDEDDAT